MNTLKIIAITAAITLTGCVTAPVQDSFIEPKTTGASNSAHQAWVAKNFSGSKHQRAVRDARVKRYQPVNNPMLWFKAAEITQRTFNPQMYYHQPPAIRTTVCGPVGQYNVCNSF